jgi:hypothetical protein
MAAAPRSPTTTGLAGTSAGASDAWSSPEYRWEDAAFTNRPGGKGRAQSSRGIRRSVDPRGAFVVLVSLVLVAACFGPYYTVPGGILGSAHSQTFAVISGTFGSWRIVIPGVCVLTAAIGILNSILRVGQRGSVLVFFLMRVMVFCQLAVWLAPIFVHHYVGTVPHSATLPDATVGVGWYGYSCGAVAFVAIAGSMATMGKSEPKM